jgi:hypothetical protein
MKKLSITKLIDFRRKSDRSKKTFVANIKSNKVEAQTDSGGDYWITSVSAVNASFKQDDLRLMDYKIDELEDKLDGTKHTITKNMYQRNIDNLKTCKTLDLIKLRPSGRLEVLKKSTASNLLVIKGLEIQVKPSCVFKFKKNDIEGIGGIWFVAKKDGYRIEEVGMVTDLLYKYLKSNYSKKYQLNPRYCAAVDVVSGHMITYYQIENGDVSTVLISTLDEINKLM